MTAGSRSVVTSPSARPSAMSRSNRRMIFPERVLGRSSVQMMRLGRANLPIREATIAVHDEVQSEQAPVGIPRAHRVGARLVGKPALDVVVGERSGAEPVEVGAANDDPDHGRGQPDGFGDDRGQDAAVSHATPRDGDNETKTSALD